MANEVDKLKIDVVLKDIAGEEKKFTTFKSLNTFVGDEFNYWRPVFQEHSRHNPLAQLLSAINTAYQEVNNYKNGFPSWDENARNNHLMTCTNRVKAHFAQLPYSKTPLGIAFTEICELGVQQAHAFWVAVTGHNNGQLQNNSAETLEGWILGYEYSHQGESPTSKRRDSEKRALAALRQSLSDKTDEIIRDTDDFKAEINEWKTTSQKELADDREAYKNEQEEFLTTSAQDLNKQLEENKANLDNFFESANKRLDELEALYREKLRLEPAAAYWRNRATDLKKSGERWGAILAAITIATGTGFAFLFHDWLTSGKIVERLSAMHWQGAILLVATLTMFIYLIRVLGKMTFSSFHLQRDAEEREMLSYLYLALSEKGNVDNESRQVVLQSLFSRAETGLLSGDHGPTIPVAEVVQKLKSN